MALPAHRPSPIGPGLQPRQSPRVGAAEAGQLSHCSRPGSLSRPQQRAPAVYPPLARASPRQTRPPPAPLPPLGPDGADQQRAPALPPWGLSVGLAARLARVGQRGLPGPEKAGYSYRCPSGRQARYGRSCPSSATPAGRPGQRQRGRHTAYPLGAVLTQRAPAWVAAWARAQSRPRKRGPPC